MAFAINDRITISIYFNDIEFPLSKLNILNFLHISSSLKALVPQFHMSIIDQIGMLTKLGVKDSTKVTVTIQAIGLQSNTKTYNFRVLNYKNAQTQQGMLWEMDGFIDAIPYWMITTGSGIRGTSNAALQEIASRCGLTYDGTTTSDAMLWLPQNQIYGRFAQYIASHGYANDQSCMRTVVTKEGKLKYKNLNDLPDATYKLAQGEFKQGFLPIVDHQPSAAAGLNNSLTGYQYTRRQQSTIGALQTAFNELTFKPDSKSPLYSMDVKDKVTRGRQAYSPVNIGNVADGYERGRYQNTRYGNLFSLSTEFLSIYPTPLEMLSKFEFSSQSLSHTADNGTTGTYIQSLHVIYIQGPNYYEKIGGIRHGTNITS